jgi:hypothetical protein
LYYLRVFGSEIIQVVLIISRLPDDGMTLGSARPLFEVSIIALKRSREQLNRRRKV